MNKNVFVIPRFLQEIAHDFKFFLDSVISTEYEFLGERISFTFLTNDREFEFIFEFEPSYYKEDTEVFKVCEVTNLKSLRIETVRYNGQLLEFNETQLKDASIGGLKHLIEELINQTEIVDSL